MLCHAHPHAEEPTLPKRGIVSQHRLTKTRDGAPSRRTTLLILALLLLILGATCGRKPKYRVPPPIPAVLGAKETGQASWYGDPYHGRRTSNGEIYDMDQMTAAHLRLPFGTWVRVTNLQNGLRTDVRINDRGPFVKNRIIDLSREAARRIEMIGPGTARVRLEVIALPGTQPGQPHRTESDCNENPAYGVQVGSFRVRENAERLRDKMNAAYRNARVLRKKTPNGLRYTVLLGAGANSNAATSLMERLRRDNIDSFMVYISKGEFLDCL